MAADMKSSIHRFRLQRASPTGPPESDDGSRRRSASPSGRDPSLSILAGMDGASSSAEPPLSTASTMSVPTSSADGTLGRGGGGSTGRPAVPACDRCRSFKKKCSRTFPVCTLCANAGQKCSYSTPASTAQGQAVQLGARVQWLTDFINKNWLGDSHAVGIEAIETGTDLQSLLGTPQAGAGADASPASSRHTRPTQGLGTAPATPHTDFPAGHGMTDGLDLVSANRGALLDQRTIDDPNTCSPLDPGSAGPTSSHPSYQGSVGGPDSSSSRRFSIHQALPSGAAARRFVDAYFRNVNRAYPFVDQAKVLRHLEAPHEFASRHHHHRDAGSTLLYLVMAIGCTTLERAGQIPRDTSRRFDIVYAEITQDCLSDESIESIQILVLLALYSLFDPRGTPSYSIVGIAARQAVLLGFSRRATASTDMDDEQLAQSASGNETELRHRLYWSIFVLDRMMAISHGLPVALTDENADVPMPGLTIDEFASAERASHARNLQTSRHVIQLRQLEDRILRQVHFRPRADVAGLAPPDRRVALAAIRADIEDWYSSGCLMSPMEPDNVPIHCSITWLSARYYHLLLLLYYPNHFNSTAAAVPRPELLQFVRRQLQSTSALFQQRQLPLNRVTLCRLLPVCLVLMHDFVASCSEYVETGGAPTGAPTAVPYPGRDEVAILISILEAFPEGWTLAHQAGHVVREFAGVISGGIRPAFDPHAALFHMGTSSGQPKDSPVELAKACITDMTGLVRQMLGKATCYQHIEYCTTEEREPVRLNNSMNFPGQQMTVSQGVPQRSAMGMPQTGISDDTVMGYGWGQLDLDFL